MIPVDLAGNYRAEGLRQLRDEAKVTFGKISPQCGSTAIGPELHVANVFSAADAFQIGSARATADKEEANAWVIAQALDHRCDGEDLMREAEVAGVMNNERPLRKGMRSDLRTVGPILGDVDI